MLDYPYVAEDLQSTQALKAAILDTIIEGVVFVTNDPAVAICRDPCDDMFFACAAAVQASYIISKDKKVLVVGEYQGITVVKPG